MSTTQKTLATATTDEITAGNQVAFSLHPRLFKDGKVPIVSVAGLASSETVSFYIWVDDAWEVLADSAGTAQVFTAGTRTADTFNSSATYGFIKDATAGAIKIQVNDAR